MIPAFNPIPTRPEREVRKARQQRGTCMAHRGCTGKNLHDGPHRVRVTTAQVTRAELYASRLIVTCPRCGFYGSGGHTTPDKVLCEPRTRRIPITRERIQTA